MEIVFFAAIVVLWITSRNRMRRVEQRLNAIEARLTALSQLPAAGPAASDKPATSAAPVEQPTARPEAVAPPSPAPDMTPASPLRPTSVPPVVPAVPRAAAGPSLEERFGTQWVVWVGGLALALGGVFLVKYSVEQDLVGPGVRIVLGALLAMALIGAGEWARRSERIAGLTGLPSAHVPSILTAAGTMAAYADVYAAYALYDFLSPAAAFVLLGVVALATLAAALLHGPALAGLGMVGAYVTPLLVSSDKPSYWALYLYLAVVTAAAFGLARIRIWRWLAITAVVFSVLWTLPGLGVFSVDELGAHVFHVIVGFLLSAALIVAGLIYGPDAEPGIDPISSSSLAAYLLAAAVVTIASSHDTLALGMYAALVVLTLGAAWRSDATAAAVPAAAILTALIFARWSLALVTEHLVLPGGPLGILPPEPSQVEYTLHIVLGLVFATLFGVSGFAAQGRSPNALIAMLWSASAAFVPTAILAALYFRIARFEPSIPFALAGLALAGLFAYAVEQLSKREPKPGLAASEAIFATGAVAALALALTMALERGWLTVALALMVPGIAWIAEKRPLPGLRWLAAVVVALVVLRVGYEPRIVGRDVGTLPILNWLLYGYGIPAAGFWYAGYLMRRRGDDTPLRMVESGAILFTVFLVTLQIRHFINGGDIYRTSSVMAEIGLQVCAAIAMTIGLERVRERSGSIVHNIGALLLYLVSLAGIVVGLGIVANPLLFSWRVGGPIINLVLLCYGIPAILMAALALLTRGRRPQSYSAIAAIAAVGLALMYLTAQVARFFHGEVLSRGPTSDAEQYTYSAVWLVFGVGLLAVAFFLRSQPLRYASAAVVTLTVAKVFLLDMSDLTGIYRALSFIGLGVVLIGIGLLYQRLLFAKPSGPKSAVQTSTS